MIGTGSEVASLHSANPHLARARALATLLDSSILIPGTARRIGLDPIIGLIPFVGDFAGALLSSYIVLAAAFAGASVFTLIRMIVNIGIDTLVGSIPLFGDIFDAAWKSNAMNIALFERHVATYGGEGRTAKSVPRMLAVIILISSLLLLALLMFVGVLVYFFLSHAISGR